MCSSDQTYVPQTIGNIDVEFPRSSKHKIFREVCAFHDNVIKNVAITQNMILEIYESNIRTL